MVEIETMQPFSYQSECHCAKTYLITVVKFF